MIYNIYLLFGKLNDYLIALFNESSELKIAVIIQILDWWQLPDKVILNSVKYIVLA
jgi:hypothetical protein